MTTGKLPQKVHQIQNIIIYLDINHQVLEPLKHFQVLVHGFSH